MARNNEKYIRQLRCSRKRLRKILKKRRKIKKKKARKNKRRKSNLRSSNLNRKNLLISYLDKSKFPRKRRAYIENYTAVVKIPKVFSFLENPDETLKTLQLIYHLASKKNVHKIIFDHSECKVLDICASTVMDVILISIKDERKRKKSILNLGGRLPLEGKVKEMLYVSGIINHLGLSKDVPFPDRIKKLNLIHGGDCSLTFRKSYNESGVAATKVTEYFNECLKTQGYVLSNEGKRIVSLMVGEVINNCEIHSGEFKQWYTMGHYSIDIKEKHGEYHLVIFNFGQTIYEGLKSESTASSIKRDLQKMSDIHKGFIGINGWDEESLWTLYALQDGVSRFRDEEKEPDRGTGTIKLINSFQKIGDTYNGKKGIMSITSGSTHILFNHKYKLEKKFFNGEDRDIIAFNKENDLRKPPDPHNVKKLKNYFPGTVIAMKFYLDKKYLEEIIKEGKNGD